MTSQLLSLADDIHEGGVHFCTQDPCPVQDAEIAARFEYAFETPYTSQEDLPE